MKKLMIILFFIFILFGCKKEEDNVEGITNLFNSGLLAVGKNNQWGYIDQNGEVIIDFSFDYASAFFEDTAIVREDGLYYVINKQGEAVFSERYEYIERLEDGHMLYTENVFFGLMNQDGTKISDAIYDNGRYEYQDGLLLISKNLKFGFIDLNNDIIIDFIYDFAFPFSHGLAPVLKDNAWNYIDMEGNIVLNVDSQRATAFDEEGCAIISKGIASEEKFYLINLEGEYILEDMEAIVGSGPIYAVETDNVYKLYKKDGTLFNHDTIDHVIDVQDYYVFAFHDGNISHFLYDEDGTLLATATNNDGFYLPLDIRNIHKPYFQVREQGQVKLYYEDDVIEVEADEFVQYVDPDHYILQRGLYKGMIDNENNVILPFEYINLFKSSDNFYIFETSEGIGFMNSQFEVLFEERYEAINTDYLAY